MRCDVGCPYIVRAFDEDWSLAAPTGKSDAPEIQMVMRKDSKRVKTKFLVVDILGFKEYNFNKTT
jgi:hypothetical protein